MTCPDCQKPLPPNAPGGVCPRCVAAGFYGDEEAEPITLDEPLREAGEKIGLYQLIEPLGEGGFGIVYRAEQVEPFQRQVALKLIKPGLDSRMVLARFDAERQALSMLDHANIARVLDAGTADDGRPFFVMELVPGRPVTEHCQRFRLTLEERLRLFLQICAGVEHAHAKGVIHRDLKPTNLLVIPPQGEVGARAVIIDFGIAKAMWQELTPHTLYTSPQQMLGTPDYMSPEQAQNGGLDIDTRADVYSLGAVLYEMLTGHPPLQRNELAKASLEECLRAIRETVPPRPSRELAAQGAAARDLRLLSARTEAELDWVVLKALAKERERRYQTVRELAEDVRCFLKHEPVQARPPTASYLVGKFVRRHRVMAAASAAVLLALGMAGVVSAVMRQKAERAELETRRAFSQAEEQAAAGEMQDAWGYAVARLCRALRTDPDNRTARYRLLVLMGAGSSGFLEAPMMVHEEPVTGARMLPPEGREVLTVTPQDGTMHHWRSGAGETNKLREYRVPGRLRSWNVTPDSTRVMAVGTGEDGGVGRVWALSDGQAVSPEIRLGDAAGGLTQAVLSPEGDTVFAVFSSGRLGSWEVASGRALWEAAELDGVPESISISPDGKMLAVGWRDGAMSLNEASGGRELWRRVLLRRAVTGTAFSVDGSLALATLGESYSRAVRTTEPLGELVATYEHHFYMEDLTLDPTGKRMSSGGVDGWLRLRPIEGGFIAATKMPGTVKSLAFSPDGQMLLAGTEEPYAGFTRVSGVTGSRLSPAVPVGRAVVDMAMSPSGRSAVPVANSLEVGVFDLRERRLRPRILKTGVGCRYAAFLPNGTLVTLNRDAGFRRWDGRTFKGIGEPILLAEADRLDARVFSADGRVAVVWTQPGKLEMVDLWDWRPLGTIPCGDSKSWLALSADGERLAVAEPGAEEVRLYDTATAALLQSWVPGGGKITFAGLSPAGDLLVAGHEDGGVLFKALPSGKVQRVQMEEAVQRVTIRADGKRAVGATLRATLKVWDLEAMTELRYPEKPPGHQGSGHGGRGLLSQFSRDGQRFFTWSSQDKMVRVFKAEDGSQDGPPLEHQDTVTHLAESPDGRMLLTKDMDERVYLWDLERRLQMTEVGLFGNELAARAFSPSGDRVLVAGMAGTVWIWPHPPGLGEHLPESFLDFAEGMGLWRVGADRAFQRVTYTELARARQEVLALPSDACDPRTLKWMKWLAEDPEKRSIWPE